MTKTQENSGVMYPNKLVAKIASFFHFQDRSATFKKEFIGGLATFMAMAYILAVNPSILSNSSGGKGYEGVFFLGTAISAMVATLAMGLFANVPVALAPGMGVNAFFAYTVSSAVLGLQVEQALVATFASGILYAIIALTPARKYIAKLLPRNVKLAIGAMIGLFLAYIGLSDAGIIVSDAANIGGPYLGSATKTKLGNFADPYVIIAIVTMVLAFTLHFLKIKGAALIAMLAAIVMLAIAVGAHVSDSQDIFKMQDYHSFSKFGDLSSKMWKSFGSTFTQGPAYIAIFVFLYIDFFDTTGTLFSVGEQAQLNNKDEKWIVKANVVDAGATIFGSLMLTSTTTSYIESSVGVSQGAKTGFASVFTGLLFGLTIAAWPLLSCIMPISHAIPGLAAQSNAFAPTIMPVTGPILVLVGALMISQLKHFDWKQTIDIPVLFVTLIFGTLGMSISTGIAAGVIIFFVLNAAGLLVQTIQTKRGKPFTVNDEEISLSSNTDKVSSVNPDFRKRVFNPVIITMFILAVAYFATMPLYAY